MPDLRTITEVAAHGDHDAGCCCQPPALDAARATGTPLLPSNATKRQHLVRVSVVVPTCGRPQLLQRCLTSLMVQQFNPHHVEIIVVDDAVQSTLSSVTRALVVECAVSTVAHGLEIRYLPPLGPTAPHGPAAARNRGWRSARGAIVAFTDDDTQARADWLACGMDGFSQLSMSGLTGSATPQVDAVWGRITMPLHGPASDYELDAKGLERAEFVTANCFCRRSVLERIDGFDERFRMAWREDADLYFRLLDAGVRVLHVPSAVVVRPIRPAGWGVSLQQQRKILFDALLFKKHPIRYREKIRARPRWDYYVIVAALVGAAAASFNDQPPLAATLAAIWLVLTMSFCLRRLRPAIKTPSHILEMIVTSALIPPVAVFWRLVGALRFKVGFL